jgi:hypothetical protein
VPKEERIKEGSTKFKEIITENLPHSQKLKFDLSGLRNYTKNKVSAQQKKQSI